MMTPTRLRLERGFSLIELMVAITISLIILVAVATMFVNARKAYTNQDRFARIQENGRFAMYYLLRDLREANYTGCIQNPTGGATAANAADPNTVGKLRNDLSTLTGFFFGLDKLSTTIEGIDDVSATANPLWSPSGDGTLPATLWKGAAAATAKPDMLAIRMVDTFARAQVIDNPMGSFQANLDLDNGAPFAKGDIVMVSDCTKADIFQISDKPSVNQLAHSTSCPVGMTPCNSKSDLSKQYGSEGRTPSPAMVFKFATRRYYIALNPSSGVPSLYRDDNGTNPVELVEGIESMKILYGVATPPNVAPGIYKKAGAMSAADWANVVSLRIGILARTPNTRDTDTDTIVYNVNGTLLGPFNDRNSRRVFDGTVVLKNRIAP